MLLKFLHKFTAISTDPITVEIGEGVYSGEEWGKTRKESTMLCNAPNDATYRQNLYDDFKKAIEAVELTNRIDFKNFRHLGDIGGVPFIQASVIVDRNPHLFATLTDYDSITVRSLAHTPMLKQHKFEVFDAKCDDLTVFNDCDVITMWGVDYALTDEEIGRIVQFCVSKRKTMILGAVHVTPWSGFKAFFAFTWLGTQLRELIKGKRPKTRKHGTHRTGYYLTLLIQKYGGSVKNRWHMFDKNLFLIQ